MLLLVGDFNARVGSSERREDGSIWQGVRGYGVGRMNESGEALLSFCALNELSIMNTWFEKNIYMYTWQHPGSKKWHCIDYVMMRRNKRRLCCDVTVIRSAECWTDQLLRAQLRLKLPSKMPRGRTRKRFSVASLRNETVRLEYISRVGEEVEGKWKNEADVEEKWEVIRDGLTKAAESVLGWEGRKQPDWFQENITTLQELISKRNHLFAKWLRTHHHSDRQRYVAQREQLHRR